MLYPTELRAPRYELYLVAYVLYRYSDCVILLYLFIFKKLFFAKAILVIKVLLRGVESRFREQLA